MKLYYHKTDGGAEYLCSNYILCKNGHKEGNLNSDIIVRIDGDITRDAEISIHPRFLQPPLFIAETY